MNAHLPVADNFGYLSLNNGKRLDLSNPDPAMMGIDIISGALSKLCRFSGQINEFYSVAQHSVLVSHLVPPHLAFAGLMHDATEAFCADLPKPIKQLLHGYEEIEQRIWAALCNRYSLPLELPVEVHVADQIAVITEARDLQSNNDWMCWYPHLTPNKGKVIPWDHDKAAFMFINHYRALMDTENE
jgi:uncharacterized protein